MQRFDSRFPCPNCGGGGHLPQGQGSRCWGISYEDSFLCTREELSPHCKETDSGFLHYYDRCRCGRPHDGTQVKVAQRAAPPNPNRNKEFAQQIWNESINPEGTSTHDYLRNRGIEIFSDQIRHHEALAHTPSGMCLEAMVVRVSDGRNQFMGIERHYINGGAKAFDAQNKMSLGSTQGGSVKLANLDSSGVLGVAEGVITAMTLIQELDIPVWACLGASNLSKVQLPPLGIINEVKIFTDGDEAGDKARDRAGDQLLAKGYRVMTSPAPPGLDYNDILNGDTK